MSWHEKLSTMSWHSPGNQYNSRPTTNIDTTLDIDDEQHYLRITRYCNVRIESILLDVNEKKS